MTHFLLKIGNLLVTLCKDPHFCSKSAIFGKTPCTMTHIFVQNWRYKPAKYSDFTQISENTSSSCMDHIPSIIYGALNQPKSEIQNDLWGSKSILDPQKCAPTNVPD